MRVTTAYMSSHEVLQGKMNVSPLYPHWVDSVTKTGNDTYEMMAADKVSELGVTLTTNQELGTIDLDVPPGEVSRPRLIPLGPEKTLPIYVAGTGPQPDDLVASIVERHGSGLSERQTCYRNQFADRSAIAQSPTSDPSRLDDAAIEWAAEFPNLKRSHVTSPGISLHSYGASHIDSSSRRE
jgi:hypothetical protein